MCIGGAIRLIVTSDLTVLMNFIICRVDVCTLTKVLTRALGYNVNQTRTVPSFVRWHNVSASETFQLMPRASPATAEIFLSICLSLSCNKVDLIISLVVPPVSGGLSIIDAVEEPVRAC